MTTRLTGLELANKIGANRKGTAQVVADHLVERIVSGELRPGSHLIEATIAQELGISKTPIREALRALPETGLVEVIPYRGAFVRDITPEFMQEVLTLRSHLETYAATLALPNLTEEDLGMMLAVAGEMEELTQRGDHLGTVRLDVQFHQVLYDRSNHSLLGETWKWLLPRVELLQAYGRIQASPLPVGHVVKRHQRLVDALREGNPETVRFEVEEHIRMGQTMATLHSTPEE